MYYHLIIVGFLNLEDENAAGNQGFKDQALALKWVKENIANFGGDPERITLFGQSAGSVSVHTLLLSPLTKGIIPTYKMVKSKFDFNIVSGLVHRAILQSGVLLNDWASIPR